MLQKGNSYIYSYLQSFAYLCHNAGCMGQPIRHKLTSNCLLAQLITISPLVLLYYKKNLSQNINHLRTEDRYRHVKV